MAPHSPGTHQIETLTTIGFLAAAIVIVAINVALLYVLRRYRSERGAEPRQIKGGRRIQFRVGAVLTAFAAAILVLSLIYTNMANETPVTDPNGLQTAHSEPLKIEATGQQWIWRYDYPNGAFSYYKLVVPVDTAIELALVSTDVVHTWNVPDLAPQRDAVPGKRTRLVFLAEEEGVFDGQSSTFSGQGYAPMRIEVDAVSPPRYEAFIKRQRSEVQAAQDRVERLIKNGKVP